MYNNKKMSLLSIIESLREPLRIIYVEAQERERIDREIRQQYEKIQRLRNKRFPVLLPFLSTCGVLAFSYFIFYLFTFMMQIGSGNEKTADLIPIKGVWLYGSILTFGVFFLIFFLAESKKLRRADQALSELQQRRKAINTNLYQRVLSVKEPVKILPLEHRYHMAAEYIYSCLLGEEVNTVIRAIMFYEKQIQDWERESRYFRPDIRDFALHKLAVKGQQKRLTDFAFHSLMGMEAEALQSADANTIKRGRLYLKDVTLKCSYWDDLNGSLYKEQREVGKGISENTGVFVDFRERLIDSDEYKVYLKLSESIKDDYILLPHVHLCDIFQLNVSEEVPEFGGKLYKLRSLHVDFLILQRDIWKPVAAIEIDGSYHETDEQQRKNDKLKKLMFDTYHIPMLHVDVNDARLLDVSYYKEKLYASEAELPVYHECGERMEFHPTGIAEKGGAFYKCRACEKKYTKEELNSINKIRCRNGSLHEIKINLNKNKAGYLRPDIFK